MKKILVVIGVTLALTVGAAAQDTPRAEVFLGYTYVRFKVSDNIPNFNANGGSGQFAYNFTDSFSGVVDLGGVHNGSIRGTSIDTTVANFLAGPRYGMRRGKFRPYVQALFGGAYATSSFRVSVIPVAIAGSNGPILVDPNQVIDTRLTNSHTKFALTAGGGLDIKASKHVSIRPIQLEYFMTKFGQLPTDDVNRQNNLRYSAGVNFTFGAR